MTGQDGNNSGMKVWVEAVVGEPGHLWIDGRALNETLQLRCENEDLRKQLNSCHERAADLAGHYRKLVQERDDLQDEVERLKGNGEGADS